MWHSTCGLLLLLFCSNPLLAQKIGEPSKVDLAEGSTTVTLDFSDHDYELILYSTQTDVETSGFGIGHPFGFSVTAAYGDSDPVIAHNPGARRPTAVPDDVGVDFMLRKQERELARHLQQSGGYHPPTAKIVSQQIGSTRDFVFPGYACWIIENDTTITAVLYATSQRANAYVDVADTGRVSKEQIQAQVDRFSTRTYPKITSAFGSESDVDNDGKIHFLYTNLTDPDPNVLFAGAWGIFDARALLPVRLGGNGNRSDMFYVNPDLKPEDFDPVIAHEFQHLINFNQHVLLRNKQSEELWLNEGLSHVAEDLIGEFSRSKRWDVDVFFWNTERGALGAPSPPERARRGAAYMFLCSLIEEFGSGIVTRLVQTNKSGISNIENATGRSIVDIFERHVSRLFLSGLGLNPKLNYTAAPLVNDVSQGRAFPLPAEFVLWPEGGYQRNHEQRAVKPDSSGAVTVNGVVHQLSSAYVRLMGDRSPTTLIIHANPNGKIRAQFIPIPKGFSPGLDVPPDYPPRVTFHPPLPVQVNTMEAIWISGTVSDSSYSIAVKFHIYNDEREEILRSPVTKGRFSRSISFARGEIGEYWLNVGAQQDLRGTGIPWRGYYMSHYYQLNVVAGNAPTPDFDRDGAVAFQDFIAFARAFGGSSSDEDFDPAFDLDEDGEIGFSDFLIFSKAFGSQVGS